MLVDPEFACPDPHMAMILAFMADGSSVIPERISQGIYLASHWNVGNLVRGGVRERWRENISDRLDFDEFGVCDTYEQPVEQFGLADRPEPFFISFVEILKSRQPYDGGWRWPKWGEYIGTQKPTREYLHDEPEIDRVLTFHVYELPEREPS